MSSYLSITIFLSVESRYNQYEYIMSDFMQIEKNILKTYIQNMNVDDMNNDQKYSVTRLGIKHIKIFNIFWLFFFSGRC